MKNMNNRHPNPNTPSLDQLLQAYQQMAHSVEQHRLAANKPQMVSPSPSRTKMYLVSHLRTTVVAGITVFALCLLLPTPDGYCMNIGADRQVSIETIHHTLHIL